MFARENTSTGQRSVHYVYAAGGLWRIRLNYH